MRWEVVKIRYYENKNCPFCGNPPPHAIKTGFAKNEIKWACTNCMAQGPPESDRKKAIKSFNTRAY